MYILTKNCKFSNLPSWPEASRSRSIFSRFLKFFLSLFNQSFQHDSLPFSDSGPYLPFSGIRALACHNFGRSNALDCLKLVQGLRSFVVSKSRKRHLRDTYLEVFCRGACPWTPIEAHAFGARQNPPLFSFFS